MCHCCTPVAVIDLTPVLTQLNEILARLTSLETHMATAAEQLNTLTAAVQDVHADFTALIETLNAERENLTPAGQAALDQANAALGALDEAVGDADGSDTPPPPPVEPVEP
jgi:multidrug resistance efflux pump